MNGASCLLNVGRVALGRVFFGESCLRASCLWGELSVIRNKTFRSQSISRLDSLPSAEMCAIFMCCLHSECVLSASRPACTFGPSFQGWCVAKFRIWQRVKHLGWTIKTIYMCSESAIPNSLAVRLTL